MSFPNESWLSEPDEQEYDEDFLPECPYCYKLVACWCGNCKEHYDCDEGEE